MNDLVLLPIVGAVVSVLVQFIKSSAGTSRPQTIALVVAFSVLSAGAYWFVNETAVWEVALQVLLYANAVYGFIISYFEE
jgi:hypothetical protein